MTFYWYLLLYNLDGDAMKVKIIDESHEKDLEESVNNFIGSVNVIDIKYQVSVAIFAEEQIYCFSALIMYKG